MDGRKHPDDLDPTWYGHSIGHWDNQTLVCRTRLDSTISSGSTAWGHPHTEKLHTIERYTRTDLGTMAIEVTIDGSRRLHQALSPCRSAGPASLAGTEDFSEYICQEENTDVEHLSEPGAGSRRRRAVGRKCAASTHKTWRSVPPGRWRSRSRSKKEVRLVTAIISLTPRVKSPWLYNPPPALRPRRNPGKVRMHG